MADPVVMGGAQFAGNKLLVFAMALIFSLGLMVLLRKTLLGKGVRALMQSQVGAQLVGINTRTLHPLMFGIGLGLSGLAGCLLSMAYTISPAMGEPYTVPSLKALLSYVVFIGVLLLRPKGLFTK
jgi:branched-chain amino acid transport system permease protein